MIILAGDIGGTKTWLQIAAYSPSSSTEGSPIRDDFRILFEQRYVSAEYASFDDLLVEFLSGASQQALSLPTHACIGVAGPVETDSTENVTARVTNLPWELDAREIATRHQLVHCHLINDFQAIAFGLEMLGDNQIVSLQEGVPRPDTTKAPKAVIGAGTGLGQALLVWSGKDMGGEYEVIASEGGHCDFAPGNEVQRGLLSFLAEQQARVSVEDVLSGRGLVNIYHYFANQYPTDVNEALTRAMANGDAAAEVSQAGLSAPSSLAGRALALFVEIYGTQAGNFALTCMATGGVYIAGGIAAKIRECFTAESFLVAFQDKYPMQHMMKTIPVNLVLDPQVGLKGAALVASRL